MKFKVNHEHDYTTLLAGMKALAKTEKKISHETSTALLKGWNSTWAINREFMQVIWEAAMKDPGNILECGAGISTLVVGIALAKMKSKYSIYALEQKEWYAKDVDSYVKRFGLQKYVEVIHSPLKVRGEYSWYTPDLKLLPDFKLVICDGPPGGTKGQRYGLLPVMRKKLSKECVILLDDAGLKKGKIALQKWEKELGKKAEIYGATKRYGVLII